MIDGAIKIYKEIKNILKKTFKLNNLNVKIFLAGSVAKKTSIDNKELDVYLLHEDNELIHKIITSINWTYTEHKAISKYITVNFNNYYIDIVPMSKNTNNTMLASLKHVAYIKKHLKYPKEVIKLKKYLIKTKLYHSVIEGGFSGYICELLLIRFTTFKNLFKKTITVLDYLKTIRDPTEPRRELFKGYTISVYNKFKLMLSLKNKSNLLNIKNLKFKLFKLNYEKSLFIKIKNIHYLLHNTGHFFEYITINASIYIICYNLLYLVKKSTLLNSKMNLKNIIENNYFFTKFNNIASCRLFCVDLTILYKMKLKIEKKEMSLVKKYIKYEYITNIANIKYII
jgi:hypothetical protein